MGVRGWRAAGPGRDRRRRALALTLAAGALYLAAALLVTWPTASHLGSSFGARGQEGHGGPSPGDHLQAVYNLWLPGDQLVHGRAPWRDAYEFQPESPERVNPAGWPLALVFWLLERLLGAVLAWNLLGLALYVVAGGVTALWLRALGVSVGAAIVGGLAFAIAPYRVAQSTEHLLGPLSILLPAALWAWERERWWLAAAALASIPLAGQLHLALGAVPFFVAYALVRGGGRRAGRLQRPDRTAVWWALGAGAAAVAAGVLVRQVTIPGSVSEGGRSLDAVDRWSAAPLDLLSRAERGDLEQFAFLGWLTPLLAVAGLVLLARSRRWGLAAVLGLGVLAPVVLALGTNTPLYEPLWHALPPLRLPRVPERLLPVACLALAALAAVAITRVVALRRDGAWHLGVSVAAAALVVADLAVFPYASSATDPANRAYAALPAARILELPVFRPEIHYGSVYQSYALQEARERPGGYSTVADRSADRTMRVLRPLNRGDWGDGRAELVHRLGVRAVLVHAGLFVDNPAVQGTRAAAERGLRRAGWRPSVRDGDVTLWLR
jgi:hypothetical protein